MTNPKFRIGRADRRNLIIQQQTGNTWRTLGYFGNSISSLAAGLMALVVSQCEPDQAGPITRQLVTLQRCVTDQATRILAAIQNQPGIDP